MSMFLKLTVAIGAITLISAILLVRAETDQLKRRSREATEEGLVDFVGTIRELIVDDEVLKGKMSEQEILSSTLLRLKSAFKSSINADIYGFSKSSIDTAILLFDQNGILRFDSSSTRPLGESYADWRDIGLARRGGYGARTTADRSDGCSTMYASIPLFSQNQKDILGVISAAKPTCTSNLFVSQARRQVILISITVFSGAACIGFLALFLFTRPLRRLSHFVRSVRDGKPIAPPSMPNGEMRELLGAIEEMRRAIDGTQMTARYMRTISHELKSPLTAIRGAVEILQDTSSSDFDTRSRFLHNIEKDTNRIVELVDNLITLNSLGAYDPGSTSDVCSLHRILDEVKDRISTQAEAKSVRLQFDLDDIETPINGSPFLIREAITNLIRNAIAFSPEGASVEIYLRCQNTSALLTIRDHGPGIPTWALPRIFDQFFSLPRPTTGHRSTGLGLPIAREAIELIGGSLEIKNQPPGGVLVEMTFMTSAASSS